MEIAKRREVVIDEKEAATWIKDGMTVAIGGLAASGKPVAIIRQIIKNGVKDLTIVGSNLCFEADMLIGEGRVKKLIAVYVGAESLCPIAPMFRAMAQRGELNIWECGEGHLQAGLSASGMALPFLPTRDGVGTSYPELNPDLKLFKDPIKGETLIAVPPIDVDVAILQAAYSDVYGNVQYVGSSRWDKSFMRAADTVIVQVEKLVPNEDIKKNPELTVIPGASAVVRAPYGAHPFASPGFYIHDEEHIREYVSAANTFLKQGDRRPFEAYLDKYVYGPETHADYLEQIGIKRLISLYEY